MVAARIYKSKGDIQNAAKEIEMIREKWLQIHPQVVVERDKLCVTYSRLRLAAG